MDVDFVVEVQWRQVLHRHLQHGEVDAGGPHLQIGMADCPEVLDTRCFEVQEVGAVVNHAHGIGFGEADAHPVTERISADSAGRIDAEAHVRDGTGAG